MNRQEKEVMVETLKTGFLQSQGSFIVGFQGMTVKQLQALRRDLKKSGGKMQVTKARLMRRAVQDLSCAQDLEPYFKSQIALIFAQTQAPTVAKVILDTAKGNEKLVIIAGCIDSKLLDQEGVKFVASLPSREVLLAQLAGMLQLPAVQLVGLLNQLIVRLLLVLKAIGEKKEQ
jgi:large subunit ribosomal protein L10